MQVHWTKCTGAVWCSFENVDLSNVSVEGVYLIGYGAITGVTKTVRTIYVGQGNVADRIVAHRSDPRIADHATGGRMHVTWTAISSRLRDGVERYLANELSPLVGTHHPDVAPVEVNLPGGWV